MEQGQKFKQIRKQKIHYSETRQQLDLEESSDLKITKHHSNDTFQTFKHLKSNIMNFRTRISCGRNLHKTWRNQFIIKPQII